MKPFFVILDRESVDIIFESLETYKSLASHQHLKYSYDVVQSLYNSLASFMSCFNSLIVKVERRTNTSSSPFQMVFERSIELNDNIVVPYDSIISSLRFLFGRDVVVSFSSELFEYKNE